MKSDPEADLLTGEWAVLGLIVEAPSHGFAIARLLAPQSELGTVWTMKRPRVYRAISDLAARGHIEPVGTARSERGPERLVYAATTQGREALELWLASPVAHVRHVRSDLLLKLALLFRRKKSTKRLLARQRKVLEGSLVKLEAALGEADGFETVLLRYRLASLRAAVEFIDATNT